MDAELTKFIRQLAKDFLLEWLRIELNREGAFKDIPREVFLAHRLNSQDVVIGPCYECKEGTKYFLEIQPYCGCRG